MIDESTERTIAIRVSDGELALIESALHLLLQSEDDAETIAELKVLLARVRAARGRREVTA